MENNTVTLYLQMKNIKRCTLPKIILRLFKSKNCEKYRSNPQYYVEKPPAIIDRDTWESVQIGCQER